MVRREPNSEERVGSLFSNSDLFGQFECKRLNCSLIIVWLCLWGHWWSLVIMSRNWKFSDSEWSHSWALDSKKDVKKLSCYPLLPFLFVLFALLSIMRLGDTLSNGKEKKKKKVSSICSVSSFYVKNGPFFIPFTQHFTAASPSPVHCEWKEPRHQGDQIYKHTM